jgi:small subunit ribosomal protein S4
MGYADSRAQARQIVRHGHIDVNGHKVDIPSYACKPGDQIALRQASRETGYVQMLQPEMRRKSIAAWMEVNTNSLSGRIARVPARDELDLNLNEQLIVEFYSR